jgi:hypothetical protein
MLRAHTASSQAAEMNTIMISSWQTQAANRRRESRQACWCCLFVVRPSFPSRHVCPEPRIICGCAIHGPGTWHANPDIASLASAVCARHTDLCDPAYNSSFHSLGQENHINRTCLPYSFVPVCVPSIRQSRACCELPARQETSEPLFPRRESFAREHRKRGKPRISESQRWRRTES